MTAPAAFQGTYSDFRLVKGRKVAQIVVEVPIEAADHALEVLGGVPRPDAERHVAVARLQIPPGATTGAAIGSAAADHPPPPERSAIAPGGAKRKFTELPLPQQVALRCNDPEFQNWCAPDDYPTKWGEAETADWVRSRCDVPSRGMIKPGSLAETAWRRLEQRFLEDTGRATESR